VALSHRNIPAVKRNRQDNRIFQRRSWHVIIGQPKNIQEVARDKSKAPTQSNRGFEEMVGASCRAGKKWTESLRILPSTADFLPCFRLLAEKAEQNGRR